MSQKDRDRLVILKQAEKRQIRQAEAAGQLQCIDRTRLLQLSPPRGSPPLWRACADCRTEPTPVPFASPRKARPRRGILT